MTVNRAMDLTTLSKSISRILRHRPDAAGVRLDKHGWCDVDDLLQGLARVGTRATREQLEQVVHGTVAANLPTIGRKGLLPMRRHHVHLSTDGASARAVGGRRGVPVVLVVDAARMDRDGHKFFVSDNGIWLTDTVPSKYLSRVPYR